MTTPRTMRAAVLAAPRNFTVETVPVPEPGQGEMRLRLHGCGVCASNLPPWEGRPWFNYPYEPGVLGHESWGVVDAHGPEVGPDAPAIGTVVASLGTKAYAEYALVASHQVLPLPASLANGAPFPGEPLACAVNIYERAAVPDEPTTIAVVGVGFLGALLIQMAVRRGHHVVAVAHRPWSQEAARRAGAQTVIADDGPGERWRAVEQVKEAVGDALCPIVIEATGKQDPLDLASELTGEMGRLVIAGYHQDGLRQVNMQLWNWRGLDVINAHERVLERYQTGMVKAVALAEQGIIDPAPLLTHALPLEQINDALVLTHDRPDGFLKAWIKFA